MDNSGNILRIAIAVSMVFASLSLLILSVKHNPAQAQTSVSQGGYIPIGIIQHDLQREGTPGYLIHIIGYCTNPAEDNKIKVLAKEWVKR